MAYHQPLPSGWGCAEDSHGRTFFINWERKETQWQDPRLQDASLNKFEGKNFPTLVKAGLALYEIQQNNAFYHLEESAMRRFLEQRQGTDPKVFVKKNDLEAMVVKCVGGNASSNAARITDRLFSLLDPKYENEMEFRAAMIGLVMLSPLTTYRKLELSYLILDTGRKGRLDQEKLFVLFKTVTKLIENQRYRYKIASSNRVLVNDVYTCLQSVKVRKGRASDGTITLPELIQYMISDPLVLRVIAMLEKIQHSRETIHHRKKCHICGVSPIPCIRYKLVDSKQNICENCFWKGQETGEFKTGLAVTEYPTKHSTGRVIHQKLSGRFLPSIPFVIHQEDRECLKQEYIDEEGRLMDRPPEPALSEQVAVAMEKRRHSSSSSSSYTSSSASSSDYSSSSSDYTSDSGSESDRS